MRITERNVEMFILETQNEIVRQYLKKRISIDLNRGENYSGRLVGQELGVGALVLRVYWRIGGLAEVVRRGDSVGKWDMNDLCGIRGLVGRGGVLFGRWGMDGLRARVG